MSNSATTQATTTTQGTTMNDQIFALYPLINKRLSNPDSEPRLSTRSNYGHP